MEKEAALFGVPLWGWMTGLLAAPALLGALGGLLWYHAKEMGAPSLENYTQEQGIKRLLREYRTLIWQEEQKAKARRKAEQANEASRRHYEI